MFKTLLCLSKERVRNPVWFSCRILTLFSPRYYCLGTKILKMLLDELEQKEHTTIETETGEKPVIKVESPQQEYEEKKKIVKNRQIVWYVLLVVEALLAIRFLLKLFGAEPLSLFSVLITIISTPLTFIFSGLFPSTTSIIGNAVIEWSTLFAMLFYAVVAFLVARFFRLKKPIGPKEAESKSEQTIP